MQSKRFQLSSADVKKWLNDTAFFLVPGVIVFLGALQMNVPMREALIALYGWGLNAVVNLLRKWYTDHSK